jgi:hypothetical protein
MVSSLRIVISEDKIDFFLDRPKPTQNRPDPKTEFPQLAKAPPKNPDFLNPPPQKTVAPVIPQPNVLPTPNPNLQAKQNYIKTLANPFAAENIVYQQLMDQRQFHQTQIQQNLILQNQFQQNQFQQNQFQQNQLQQNMRFPNMFQQNQFKSNLMLRTHSMQNLAPPQCLVPQHFTPDFAAMSQPDFGGLALDDFSSWKISRIITFVRPKGEPLGIKSCYVCRRNFVRQIHFQEHMDSVHGAEFEIPLEVTMGK